MTWIPDAALDRLSRPRELPDLTGTHYRLVEPLGQGGMGTVYVVEDTRLGREVALKVLDVSADVDDLKERLLREAQVLARLEHPGIVPVHDVGELPDGRLFYTMKWVRGHRLDRYLDGAESEPPTLGERLRLFTRICDAVAFAHSYGVLHRDLKPANIMVGAFGEILVMDWGLAKLLGEPEPAPLTSDSPGTIRAGDSRTPLATEHGMVLGTPGYMSPEQERGEVERLDARTDVFALGVLLQFMVRGTAPSASSATEQLRRSPERDFANRNVGERVPKPLRAIQAKAAHPQPQERYADAQELADDVRAYLDDRPVRAFPENWWRRAGRFVSRHRIALLLLATYMIARALVLIFLDR